MIGKLKFVSSATIKLRSGNGGKGIIAWRRESKVSRGGPDGGNGGNGGSLFIEGDHNLNSLFHVRHIKFLKAEDGRDGSNKSRHGKSASDVMLRVPLGTNIFDVKSGDKLFEIMRHEQRYMVCKGGVGGRGNASFKSANNPAPYLYELGDLGEEREIFLDLETISDIGFLGKTNAGKSSLLSRISNAHPRIASFPFTTINPVLGTVSLGGKNLVFADIPGLIENSSRGAGLGIEFLKHLSRCSLLVHLVDGSSEDVLGDISMIDEELRNYSSELHEKQRILVINKIDLLDEETIESLGKKIKGVFSKEPLFISAKEDLNIGEFLEHVFRVFKECDFIPKEKPDFLEFNDDPLLFAPIEVIGSDGVWEVTHPSLKYWVLKIPKDTDDNVSRLLQKIDSLGVNKELMKKGAKKNDLVRMYGWEYEFI